MPAKLVTSRGVGEVWLYDRWGDVPDDGRPAFHLDEVKRMQKAPVEDWRGVVVVKGVFREAVVVQWTDLVALKKRREARAKRRRWSSAPKVRHGATEDQD